MLWNGLELPGSYFHDDDMCIIKGDSRDVLPQIPDKSVDAVVTDPPYGIGFSYVNGREGHTDPDSYWSWLSPIHQMSQCKLRDGGLSATWQTQLYYKYFWGWFGDDIHIYCAAKNFVQLRKTAINYGYDPIVIFYKAGQPLKPIKPKRNIDFFVANTAKWVTQTKDLARQHPCPRPTDQTEQLISNFVVDEGIVLDPFAGAGTIGLACASSSRKCLSIEIEEKYCELATLRYIKYLATREETN